MITHIIFIKLKDRTDENRAKLKEVLMSMEGKIPELRYLEVGVDVLHSERSYDVALVSKFDSLEDLEKYQVHPYHQEVARYIGTVKDTVVAVDYESE